MDRKSHKRFGTPEPSCLSKPFGRDKMLNARRLRALLCPVSSAWLHPPSLKTHVPSARQTPSEEADSLPPRPGPHCAPSCLPSQRPPTPPPGTPLPFPPIPLPHYLCSQHRAPSSHLSTCLSIWASLWASFCLSPSPLPSLPFHLPVPVYLPEGLHCLHKELLRIHCFEDLTDRAGHGTLSPGACRSDHTPHF